MKCLIDFLKMLFVRKEKYVTLKPETEEEFEYWGEVYYGLHKRK